MHSRHRNLGNSWSTHWRRARLLAPVPTYDLFNLSLLLSSLSKTNRPPGGLEGDHVVDLDMGRCRRTDDDTSIDNLINHTTNVLFFIVIPEHIGCGA